jgi:hypothetical protein
MRLKTLSCLAAIALAPIAGQSIATASPLAQAAGAKAAVPAGIQLAQADKLRGGGGSGGGAPAVRDLNTGGGGGGGGSAIRGGGGDRGGGSAFRGRDFNTPAGVRVRDLNTTPGAGLGDSRRGFRDRSDFRDRSAFRDRRDFRRFDSDRRFVDRRIERRHVFRGDRFRHRRVFRDGVWVYPYTSYAYTGRCHRHYRGIRVLRHCHPYAYRWHHHGRWS